MITIKAAGNPVELHATLDVSLDEHPTSKTAIQQ